MNPEPIGVAMHAARKGQPLAVLLGNPNRRARRWRAVLGAFLLGIAFGLVAAAFAHAEPVRPGTFAWSYKNRPTVAPLAGYEYVVVSGRGILAPGVADSLRAAGAIPLVWLQPVVAVVDGVPIEGPDYPWDSALLELARARGGILRDPAGAPVDLFPGGKYSAWVLDLRDSTFVDELAALLVSRLLGVRAGGVLHDYGCGDLSWANLPGVDPAIWPAWRAGFVRLLEALRAARGGGIQIAQCDQWTDLAPHEDGAFFEQAGMSLNPPAKVWASANRYPGKWIFIRDEDLGAQRRRLFAAIAYLTGARFNQCDLRGDFGGGTKANAKDLEHFGMSLGASSGPWFQKAPGVYERLFARGVVLANLSSFPYVYALTSSVRYTILSSDGLTMQTRDERGRYITRITDAGR